MDPSEKRKLRRLWIFIVALSACCAFAFGGILLSGFSASMKNPINAEENEAPEAVVTLPILMYHGLVDKPGLQNTYMLDPALFEADLKYLTEHGYRAVVVEDVIRCVMEGTPLPEKPVILTFDDGFYNNLYFGGPLLKEYGMRAVISVVGALADEAGRPGAEQDNPDYSYLTWSELADMQASGLFEIQNHSYDSHTNTKLRKGVLQNPGEPDGSYREYLNRDLGYMQERTACMLGVRPSAFTYPYGAKNDRSDGFIKELGFQASLSCTEGVNRLVPGSRDADSLFSLKRILRPPGQSASAFFTKYKIE